MEFLAFFVVLVVFGVAVWLVAAQRRRSSSSVPREEKQSTAQHVAPKQQRH